MSLTSALNNALSGLSANTLEAEIIANNVANAQTPGYTRQSVELAPATLDGGGNGVAVVAVNRVEDPALIASRRRSDADLGAQAVQTSILNDLSRMIGTPGEGTAVADTAAAFETDLLAAANDPSSDARLSNAVVSADVYADNISTMSTETQRMRMEADAEIASQVDQVNNNLQSIDSLNSQIQMITLAGGDASALIDARQALIDEISSILPIRTTPREDGQVAIYTTGGVGLLDGQPAELGFTPTPTITQDMSVGAGSLSGLTVNGQPVRIGESASPGPMDGGSLGALFTARDETLPGFADQLDLMAEDLITRFQDPAVDPTLGATDAGLFTDDGAAYDPTNREGLASRLEINAAVDPNQGGDVWRLRDGMNAAAPGDSGDSSILDAMYGAALAPRDPAPGLGFSTAGGLADFAAGVTADVSTRAEQAETQTSFLSAVNLSLRDSEVGVSGVDTDSELQRLLLVEQSYAANARVLSTVDSLIQRLLEI